MRTLYLELQKYFKSNPYDIKLKKEKKFFIFGIPTHGNLGDQAIAYAQEVFFKENYPDYSIIEIPDHDVITQIRFVKKIIGKEDIIFLHGGGNLGNLYYSAERDRRKVIENFPNYKIIQLPQSFTFTEGKDGEREKLISKRIYGKKQSDLTIVAREKKSSKIFKELFNNNNHILVPDIVLSLNEKKEMDRNDILICLRGDKEQVISTNDKNLLINTFKNKHKNVRVIDTVVDYSINKDSRIRELNKKWDQFRKAKIVITDRLHGMVFAVITGTPCIVFDNYNQKVQKTYIDWLQECNGIKFVDVKRDFNINNIEKLADEIMALEIKMFVVNDKYQPLIDEINSCLAD